MSVGAARLARREAEKQAKAKRDKILLGFCLAVLALLIAWQGPKTIKKLQGPAAQTDVAPLTPIGAPTAHRGPASTTWPGVLTNPPRPNFAKREAVLRARFASRDAFVPQAAIGSTASATPAGRVPTPPAVRATHFVAKDPFLPQQTVSESAPATGPGGATVPVATAGGGYVVVIASIPTSSSRALATGVARRARAAGLANVGVLTSSAYPTLRSGFYAVYLGRFQTLKQTLAAINAAHAHGFSAYARRIGK